jgi:hypothetical protein
MLPDGAEKQTQDWTVFFLNQTPFNTIAPPLALESSPSLPSLSENAENNNNGDGDGSGEGGGGGDGEGAGDGGAGGGGSGIDHNKPELLHVLNLVRTKHDKREKRYVCVHSVVISLVCFADPLGCDGMLEEVS